MNNLLNSYNLTLEVNTIEIVLLYFPLQQVFHSLVDLGVFKAVEIDLGDFLGAMAQRFTNNRGAHTLTFQNGSETVTSYVGGQIFDAYPPTDLFQPTIRVRQHLMNPVVALLFRAMRPLVQYRKQIIVTRWVGLPVLGQNRAGLVRQWKTNRLAGLLAHVMYPALLYIFEGQAGHVREVDTCAEIAEHKEITGQSGIRPCVAQIKCYDPAYRLFGNRSFTGGGIEPVDFERCKWVIFLFNQLLFDGFVIDAP